MEIKSGWTLKLCPLPSDIQFRATTNATKRWTINDVSGECLWAFQQQQEQHDVFALWVRYICVCNINIVSGREGRSFALAALFSGWNMSMEWQRRHCGCCYCLLPTRTDWCASIVSMYFAVSYLCIQMYSIFKYLESLFTRFSRVSQKILFLLLFYSLISLR